MSPTVLCTMLGAAYSSTSLRIKSSRILYQARSSTLLAAHEDHLEELKNIQKPVPGMHHRIGSEYLRMQPELRAADGCGVTPVYCSDLPSLSLLAHSAHTTLAVLLFLAHGELISGPEPLCCLEFSPVLVQSSHPHFLNVLA